MNERVNKLAKDAGIIFGYPTYHDRLEHFAELIVRECADIADDCVVRDLNFPSEYIKDYFGVK